MICTERGVACQRLPAAAATATTQQQQRRRRRLRRPVVTAAASQQPQQQQQPRRYDVVGLCNTCLDIVVEVPQLPPPDGRAALLAELTAAPPDARFWQLGGNTNMMIAAARLGMSVCSVGHLGRDVYGAHLDSVLRAEGIAPTLRMAPPALLAERPALDATLLCFVLVDPAGGHAFCSRYDVGPWPLLDGVRRLPADVADALRSTAAVFTNGFVFDELPLSLVEEAAAVAADAGAAVCFDPGPRAFTMRAGARRAALDALLDLAHVVLMTAEEAREVTGCADPRAAAEAVLARPNARTEWCVVKLGGDGALLATRGGEVYAAGGFAVDVVDTVGCGDSFAAAVVLGYTRTHAPQATLTLANAVGAATAMGRGAGINVARAEAVRAILQQAAAAADAGAAATPAAAAAAAAAAAHDVKRAATVGGSGSAAAAPQAPAPHADAALGILAESLSTASFDDFGSGSGSDSGSGRPSSSSGAPGKSKSGAPAAHAA